MVLSSAPRRVLPIRSRLPFTRRFPAYAGTSGDFCHDRRNCTRAELARGVRRMILQENRPALRRRRPMVLARVARHQGGCAAIPGGRAAKLLRQAYAFTTRSGNDSPWGDDVGSAMRRRSPLSPQSVGWIRATDSRSHLVREATWPARLGRWGAVAQAGERRCPSDTPLRFFEDSASLVQPCGFAPETELTGARRPLPGPPSECVIQRTALWLRNEVGSAEVPKESAET
jgi:hypothetical protein